MRAAEEHVIRPETFSPPRRLDPRVRVSVRRVGGWPVYTVSPGRVRRRVVYAHGGAWVHEISPFHWWLVAGLAARTGTEFTVPIYPLVPLGTAERVVSGFADLAASLVTEAGGANVLLFGDSAGGQIALSAAMLLRARGVEAPRDIVLISPSLDLSFTDPMIPRIQPTDPWLAVPGPRAAVEYWRADRPIDDPIVSPLKGSLDGVGRITLFTGTRDITHADALTLTRKAREARHPFDLHQRDGLLHVYPLLPIPEGAEARAAMRRVLNG